MDAKLVQGRLRLSADVGGTFTDVASFDEPTGKLMLGKTLTTHQRLVTGIETGVEKAGASFPQAQLFLHGTTVAINTILERTGAPCALLTTQGFRDIYEIGRVNRPEAYNLFFQKHKPLIDRDLRFDIRERCDAQGRVLIPLDEQQVLDTVAEAVKKGVKAVAILFLHSYRNPAHEKRAKALVEQAFPDLFVTASHELSQEYREYERTSTTAANAYVGPRVRTYLGEMDKHLTETGFTGTFLVVQSTGGLFDIEEAQQSCIRMLESGPAAGVIGSKMLCDQIGLKNAIAFDMGGTTAKTSLIKAGEVSVAQGYYVGGYASGHPVMFPVVDIVEIGAGGGSIAWIDQIGALKLGPQSASSTPGPVCYRRGGTEPTVTDADLILGRLDPNGFSNGRMSLDVDGARAALAALGERVGLDAEETAAAAVRLVDANMTDAIRRVLSLAGADPRKLNLVAFGGMGDVHATTHRMRLGVHCMSPACVANRQHPICWLEDFAPAFSTSTASSRDSCRRRRSGWRRRRRSGSDAADGRRR